MAPRGFDVVGFGLNSIDLIAMVGQYPEPDSKQQMAAFVERPGGQAATAMIACARLGWRARYVGRFGDDARGRLARVGLEEEGVDLSACDDVNAPQPVSLILVDGDRLSHRAVEPGAAGQHGCGRRRPGGGHLRSCASGRLSSDGRRDPGR